MSEDYDGLESDQSGTDDGQSSSDSVSSGGTDATSIHSNDPGPCSDSDDITRSIQSHASDFKFTNAELWDLHKNNRATIPGATGPPGTCLPQVDTVSCNRVDTHLGADSSPDDCTYIWGSCLSIFDPREDRPITQLTTQMSVCPNNEDHHAGLSWLNTPGFDSASEVAQECSDRFGHLVEKVVSAVNHTGLDSQYAFSHFETLLSTQIRGEGTKAQFLAGYDKVESEMDLLLDRYWNPRVAANQSAEAERRTSDSTRVTSKALSRFPSDTWLPKSSSKSVEVQHEGSL